MDDGTTEDGAGGPSMVSASPLDDVHLGVLQRVLLTTDATVVRLLEGFFGEAIRTEGLGQTRRQALPEDTELELAGHETILCRQTLLQGCDTGRNFLYAEAWVVLDRLQPPLREGLLTTSEAIGHLLATNRIETLREVLALGRRPAGPLGLLLAIDPDDELLLRTYRIIAGGQTIMLLTEYFPALRFPAPGESPSEQIPDPGANAGAGIAS